MASEGGVNGAHCPDCSPTSLGTYDTHVALWCSFCGAIKIGGAGSEWVLPVSVGPSPLPPAEDDCLSLVKEPKVVTFGELLDDGRIFPGVTVETVSGRYKIGDVNGYGGGCDHCPVVERSEQVLAVITPFHLKSRRWV